MSSDATTLLEMGFTQLQVDKSLKATNNAGLSQALDYLDKHADAPSSFWESTTDTGDSGVHQEGDEEGAPGGAAEPKSLKCLDCGKSFRNQALAEYHSSKSQHVNFEESTEEIAPLTEEEKKAKLEELRLRMAEKKKAQAKKDAEDAKANEAIRRKGGKDQAQIKAELALKEAEKEAAQRKKDKIDDAKAKAAVRAQIAADKKARADKAAREKALRDGTPLPGTEGEASSSTAPTSTAATPSAPEKKYDQTRLQIRLAGGGAPLVHAVPSSATLGEVKQWVLEQRPDLGGVAFSSAFPRKTYYASDDSKTMTELGLSPSAVLMTS